MQMAASAFDILIGSVSDNIVLRWVWTSQRCNRTVCIRRMQFKGLTFPTSVWQRKNGLCITLLLALWDLSKRLPNLKITLQEWSSVFKFNLKWMVVFLLKKVPSWYSITNRTSCPVRSFYQSFPCFFWQAAESVVFSKLFVDTARFLW